MTKKRFFSSTGAKKAITQLTTIPTALFVALSLPTVFLSFVTIGVFLSNAFAATVAAESTVLATQFLAMIVRLLEASARIPTENTQLLLSLLGLLNDIINTIPHIIENFNTHIELLDTMSEQYDIYFDFISRFEGIEVQLRIFYRSLEDLLNIPIQDTELLPRPYELVFDDYIYALGGDPDIAAQAAGETPPSSSNSMDTN